MLLPILLGLGGAWLGHALSYFPSPQEPLKPLVNGNLLLTPLAMKAVEFKAPLERVPPFITHVDYILAFQELGREHAFQFWEQYLKKHNTPPSQQLLQNVDKIAPLTREAFKIDKRPPIIDPESAFISIKEFVRKAGIPSDNLNTKNVWDKVEEAAYRHYLRGFRDIAERLSRINISSLEKLEEIKKDVKFYRDIAKKLTGENLPDEVLRAKRLQEIKQQYKALQKYITEVENYLQEARRVKFLKKIRTPILVLTPLAAGLASAYIGKKIEDKIKN